LKSGEVDAVVFDSAVLIHYAASQGAGKVEIVGQIFQDESYAIVLVVDSALREPLNEALLRLRQNGTYDQIYEKWFGELE
jgi:polar amino acid transport system substrate-binding protein